MLILWSVMLFIVAGLCEVGGGYLVWLWLRDGKPIGYGIAGAVIFVLYGIIPTYQIPVPPLGPGPRWHQTGPL